MGFEMLLSRESDGGGWRLTSLCTSLGSGCYGGQERGLCVSKAGLKSWFQPWYQGTPLSLLTSAVRLLSPSSKGGLRG